MRLLFIVVCVVFSTILNAQDKAYLAYFETFNMHEDYQISCTRIFRSYLNQEKRYDITILPTTSDSVPIPETYEQAWRHAKEINAPFFIKGELDRLGETVVVSITLYKTDDGTKIWSDMLKAKSPDDLDPILFKMAKAIGTSNKGSDATDIYSVTKYDSQPLNQVRTHSYFGISLGGGAFNYPYKVSSIPAGFGLSFSHDMRKLIADLSGEAYFGPKSIYFFSINGNVPLKPGNNTPYLGGGIGVGGISVPQVNYYNGGGFSPDYSYTTSQSNGGLMLLASGGYIFNRTSNVRLKAGGKIILPLYTINSVYPAGLVINLEIAFGN